MTRLSPRGAAMGGAGVFLLLGAGAAQACSTASLPLHGIVEAIAGCADPCAPVGDLGTTAPARGGVPFGISMVNFAFIPDAPIIKPNTTVRWTNDGQIFQHTSTRLPTWDSGLVNPNQHFDFTFGSQHAGLEYHYECVLHPQMEADLLIARFGDANLDTVVNLADFNILAANFGQSNRTWETGDFNEDGTVNLSDFNLLAANFGRSIEPARQPLVMDFGAVVPEPATGLMVVPAMLLIARRRRT